MNQIPRLKKKILDYIGYSTATMEDVFDASELSQAQQLSARELRTGIIWNDGGKLTFESLPTEAQFAPIHAIAAGDVNGDGSLDLVLSGNVMHTRVRLGKCDANKGQVFINQGERKFTYLSQKESGLWVNGDVRAAIMAGKTLWLGINGKPWQRYNLKTKGLQ